MAIFVALLNSYGIHRHQKRSEFSEIVFSGGLQGWCSTVVHFVENENLIDVEYTTHHHSQKLIVSNIKFSYSLYARKKFKHAHEGTHHVLNVLFVSTENIQVITFMNQALMHFIKKIKTCWNICLNFLLK